MTYYERVMQALEAEEWGDEGTLDDLLRMAYFLGKEDGAQEACDMATKRWHEQQVRALRCRYWRQALKIVGDAADFTSGKGFIYHPDYSHDYSAVFGDSIWEGE